MGVVNLSEVANKPTYVIVTSSRLILAENFDLFVYLDFIVRNIGLV